MKSRFHFVFIIFCITVVLIVTVYIRNAENQQFYKICEIRAEQSRVGEQLCQKQLRLEGLLNPAVLSE